MTTKPNCWEFMHCGRESGGANVEGMGACPAGKENRCDGVNDGRYAGRICWIVGGTLCGGLVQGTFAQKMASCLECDFYRVVKQEQGPAFESGVYVLPLLTRPYQLAQSYERLFRSYKALRTVRDQLDHGDGELAANIALQINDPLTGILSHAEALFESTPVDDPVRDDYYLIISETLHCRDVVRDLLEELVAQERLAAIGETVAGLTHCLRNVLNALRGGQYIINRGLKREDPEKMLKGLKLVEKGAMRIENMTFDMLYYAKDRTPVREPTDPNEIIREVIDLLCEKAADSGVELCKQLDEQIGRIALDRTACFRAVMNLATNAIDACTEDNSGNRVTLGSCRVQGDLVLMVADNGVGMTETTRASLFRRFFSTKGSKGTGLGLLVVKKIVEEHGGVLRIETTEGMGSTIKIHLPLNG